MKRDSADSADSATPLPEPRLDSGDKTSNATTDKAAPAQATKHHARAARPIQREGARPSWPNKTQRKHWPS
jgi:hypothetical protein